MSTYYYGIRVIEKENTQVKLKVFLVYYDWDYIPNSKDFFLSILWDYADTRFYDGGPLGNEINADQIGDAEYRLKNADKFIKEVREVASLNLPIDDLSKYSTFYYEMDGKWQDEDKLAQK